MPSINHSQTGFTLIEMIVALAVFSVVITISIGSMLMLVATNLQLQAKQGVMTNLSFALDSMTREMRTGTQYYCEGRNSDQGNGNIFGEGEDLDDVDVLREDETQDCPAGRENRSFQGVAFIEGGASITGTGGRILYFFNEAEGKLYRKVGSEFPQPMTSSDIYIEDAEFYVTGSDPLSGGDGEQASITIFIKAKETEESDQAYTIQTTVTQRTLDI
jgi:prepilin-type N-terminal cleavage/methylation domain-containing protein